MVMSRRSYDLCEIDAMRTYFAHRYTDYSDCHTYEEYVAWENKKKTYIEEEVRTAMIGNIDPTDMLAWAWGKKRWTP